MIQVLIVDDSAVVREAFRALLQNVADINVIDTAQNPLFAQKKLEKYKVDVMILDIEMPEMDGLTYLKKIMQEKPMPVIICSTLASQGSQQTMEALSSGAVEAIHKPSFEINEFFEDSRDYILNAIRSASKAKVKTLKEQTKKFENPKLLVEPKLHVDEILYKSTKKVIEKTQPIVAIGGSTGAVQVIEYILKNLPHSPGIVIVQHMPEGFTDSFAQRLDKICAIDVKEASDGDEILPNQALIAPGNRHLTLFRKQGRYIVRVKDGPKISRHKPSVNVLFRSVANEAGSNAVGIILTGMGDDGADGMKEMYDVGSKTYAQDKESCVVFGMPNEAIQRGGVLHVSTPKKIVSIIKSIHG